MERQSRLLEDDSDEAGWAWRNRKCTCKDGVCVPRFHIEIKPKYASGGATENEKGQGQATAGGKYG
jgi:hypothetical protein